MSEKLTPEQEKMMDEVANEWINKAIGGNTSINEFALKEGLEWIYSVLEMKPPKITIVAGSPKGCQLAVNYLKKNPKATEKEVYEYLENPKTINEVPEEIFSFSLIGIGWDSGWSSFSDYYKRIGVIKDQTLDKWLNLINSGMWDCILFDVVAIICRRPQKVLMDDRQRLHSTTEAAVSWVDGYKNYFIHGVRVNKKVILSPETLSGEEVLTERNAEVRRVMIERLGHSKFISLVKPKVLDEDKDRLGKPRRLIQVDLNDDEPMTLVEMVNSTPETSGQPCKQCRGDEEDFTPPYANSQPHRMLKSTVCGVCYGTGRVILREKNGDPIFKNYVLRVPPDVKTCAEAISWSFSFDVKTYIPLVES